jgi:Zn-dependent protease with chaperone function
MLLLLLSLSKEVKHATRARLLMVMLLLLLLLLWLLLLLSLLVRVLAALSGPLPLPLLLLVLLLLLLLLLLLMLLLLEPAIAARGMQEALDEDLDSIEKLSPPWLIELQSADKSTRIAVRLDDNIHATVAEGLQCEPGQLEFVLWGDLRGGARGAAHEVYV